MNSPRLPQWTPIIGAAALAGNLLIHGPEELQSETAGIAAEVHGVLAETSPAASPKRRSAPKKKKRAFVRISVPRLLARHPEAKTSPPQLRELTPQQSTEDAAAWCEENPQICRLLKDKLVNHPIRLLRRGTRKLLQEIGGLLNKKDPKKMAAAQARAATAQPAALDNFMAEKTAELLSQLRDGEVPLTQANAHSLLWMLQKTRYDEDFAYAVLVGVHLECGEAKTALEILANDYDDETRGWKNALIDFGFDKNEYGAWELVRSPFRGRCMKD